VAVDAPRLLEELEAQAMKKTRRISTWAAAAWLAAGAAAPQEPEKPKATAEAAGPRLRVRLLETRQRGEQVTALPPLVLLLHAGDEEASLFAGTQVALRTSDRQSVLFKNAGVDLRIKALALGGGRYQLDAKLEQAQVLGASGTAIAPANADNPILQVVRSESRLVLRDGEKAPFASAVDPVSGDVVRVEVALDLPAVARKPAAATSPASMRARFLLTRRQGEKVIASRPYSVVLPDGDEARAANVFSGVMLPLEAVANGRATVMLKDIGAGLHLEVVRAPDGRYRVGINLSDGTLSPSAGAPRVQAFKVESRLYLAEGETVVVASAVDPQTGDVIEGQLTIEAVR
jgi:hypothetical protein